MRAEALAVSLGEAVHRREHVVLAACTRVVDRATRERCEAGAENHARVDEVRVGDVVSCYTEVSRVGRTSLTVNVDVYSERQSGAESVHVATARITYVAIDEARRPRPVPAVESGS